MQVADKHNLPFRLRYYQQQIDFDILNVGDDYTKLAQYPTYIIMFCDFDYFGCGWSKYQFENRCINDPKLKLGDQRQITIFNAKASQFHGNMKLKGFLKLMGNQIDTSDQLVKQVRTEMKRIREDPIRRHGFMKYELDLMDARREGKEEAQKEAQVKAVTMLKDLGLEQEKIISELAKTYNMSHDEALKLIQKVR